MSASASLQCRIYEQHFRCCSYFRWFYFIFFSQKIKMNTNITLEISLNAKQSENITRKYNARHDILYFCLTKPHIEHFVIQFVILELVANDHINWNNTKCNVSTWNNQRIIFFALTMDFPFEIRYYLLDGCFGQCLNFRFYFVKSRDKPNYIRILCHHSVIAARACNVFIQFVCFYGGCDSVTVRDTMSRKRRIITISIVVNKYSCRYKRNEQVEVDFF